MSTTYYTDRCVDATGPRPLNLFESAWENAEQPPTFCARCILLFSPQGLAEASSQEEGFFHSVLDDTGLSQASQCSLCNHVTKILWRDNIDKSCKGFNGWRLQVRATHVKPFQAPWNHASLANRDIGHHIHGLKFQLHAPASDQDNNASLSRSRSSVDFVTFIPVEPYETPGAKFFHCRPPEPPNTSLAFEAAKYWLQTCLTQHASCSRGGRTTLPTRVIDVATSKVHTVRLYKSSPGEEGQYAALSYCWGGPQKVILTKSSLNRLFNGIAVHELGQTIQDAIEVTRRLGLKYLWVDALCIIQDSDEDKAVELSRMSDIYHEATVTIAAGDALTSNDGFLNLRPSTLLYQRRNGYRPLVMPVGGGSDSIVQLYDNNLFFDLRRCNLTTRAWTLQEMLLSPRVLFYTKEEPIWFCQTIWDKHRDRGGLNGQLSPGFAETVWPSPVHYMIAGSERENWLDLLRSAVDRKPFWRVWGALVDAYTTRNMTFASDRIRALQAIIDTLERTSGHRCVYGHWEPWLGQLLPWCVKGGKGSPERAPTGAPSWSWASVTGPVEMLRLKDESHVTVLGLRDGDKALELEGPLVEAPELRQMLDNARNKEPLPVEIEYYPDLRTGNRGALQDGRAYLIYSTIDTESDSRVWFIEVEPTGSGRFVRTGLLYCLRRWFTWDEVLKAGERNTIWLH